MLKRSNEQAYMFLHLGRNSTHCLISTQSNKSINILFVRQRRSYMVNRGLSLQCAPALP